MPPRALTDVELRKFAKLMKIPYFRGVFMRDNLPKNGPRKNESAIVNLDITEGPGTHWVAYKKRGNLVIYFDSYGDLRPALELQKYLGDGVRIYYNHDKYQFKSYNCGHLCLEFLNKRFAF